MNNIEIAKLLRNIASAYTINNEKKYRFQINAYQKAADAIENSTSEVKDLVKEGKLINLPGIGTSIQSHLEELIKTKKVKHFEWVLKGIPESVFILLDIPTFGPKKAYRLVKEFSIKNPETAINEIENLAINGKIENLEGFGKKSQEDILRSINEFKLGKAKASRMTLPFAAELAEKIISYLKENPDVLKTYPLGSLRRMMPTIGDIDIAVATNKPKEVIKYFVSYPYKERVIEEGDTTASILISGGKQVDLMIQPKKSFGSLLQHFTGSKNHNIHLREFALKKGFSLSEYGIKKRIKNLKFRIQNFQTEEEYYHALGIDWIPPELREDRGEIELAAIHKLPKLINLEDVKGDLHIHSNFPIEPNHDLGKDTLKQMTKKAIELKYEYLGFSEHNPSVSKHSKKQIYDLIKRRNKHIEQIKSLYKNVRIFKMLEIDILANGNLSVDENVLNELDSAIVSVHSGFSKNKKEMTKRVLAGLSHKKAKILAHPTGRLINSRSGYELDWEIIFEFCKKNNKALEINACPSRLDLPDPIVKIAVDFGIKLIINTDSHAAEQMDMMKYGISVARRGWAKKSDILNTLGYNELIKWFNT